MKYQGIELKEFTSDKPVLFDPPRKMLVWNYDKVIVHANIVAYIPGYHQGAAVADYGRYDHCAEIPETTKLRRATNRELAKWLAQGNGMCKHRGGVTFHTCILCGMNEADTECASTYIVQKWDDAEWHEPTADYMGLED